MIINGLLVSAILLVGLVLFELVARRTKISKTAIRKVVHVGMCLLLIGLTFFFDYKVMILVGVFFTILLIAARRYFRLYSLRDRSDESWGEIFFPIGIGLTAAIATTQQIFIAGVLILAITDTIAFVVGRRFPGAYKITYNRTVAGSGAGLIATFIILAALGFPLLTSVIVTIGVTVGEIFSRRGADNLTLPGIAAILLVVCMYTLKA